MNAPRQASGSQLEPRILVAGIGNIFFGDDAFGCEVIRRLAERPLPAGVRVKDFGIRGLDLAYELLEGWDHAILVDAAPRGNAPGTVHVLELNDPVPAGTDTLVETHGMSPVKVLALVQSLGGLLPSLRLVGCKPLTCGSAEDPVMGLSPPVQAAVEEAAQLIEKSVSALFQTRAPIPSC